MPGLVTVSDVEVSPDQSQAKVYFTVLGDERAIPDATEGLKRAAGFLRTQLARRMKLRTVPQLHFEYDASVERGIRVSHLIDEALASAPKRQPEE